MDERQPQRAGGRRERSGRERGIALLVVMTLIVMFTAFVADFTYSARVRYIMASRARDAAQAEALAVSGLRFYNLLLMFGDSAQKRLSGTPFAAFLGSGAMVPRLIPVLDTGLLRMLGGGAVLEEEGGGAEPVTTSDGATAKGPTKVETTSVESGSFLDFEGDFSVSAADESSKISLNGMAKARKLDAPSAQLLLQTLKREEYQPLFREQNIMPEELVSNILDWADQDGDRANGQGYEDNLYSRMADPYHSKNAPYDSISELHLVAGMNDEFYAIIAPLVSAFTVSDQIAVPNNVIMFEALLRAALPNQRFTPADIEKHWEQYQLNTVLAPPDTVQALASALQMSGVPGITVEVLKPFISDPKQRPKFFTLTSTGRVNDVERTIQAVINIGQNPQTGGRIYYWREE